MARLMVFTIDYDGCADNHLNVLSILHKMRNALEADPQVHIIVMIFSARQTIQLNELNKQRNGNGCCFKNIYQLTQEFKSRYPQFAERISLEPLLLEDIHQNCDSGTHFRKALEKTSPKKRNSIGTPPTSKMTESLNRTLYADEHKVTLLYCQTHFILKKYSKLIGNGSVTFAIFDNTLTILSRLFIFYSRNSHYLPQVLVKLYHCYFNPIQQISDNEKLGEVQGTGYPQLDYIASLPKLYDLASTNQKAHNLLISSIKLSPTSKSNDILAQFQTLIKESNWQFAYYLAKRISPKEQDQRTCLSILLIAAVQNRYIQLVEQLINKKNINLALTINDNGNEKTAIEIAAALSLWDIVDLLSQAPSMPGDKLHYGSVILLALQKKQEVIAKKLFFQLNIADFDRYPLFNWAIQTQSYEFLNKALTACSAPTSNIAQYEKKINEAIQCADALKDDQALVILYHYVTDPLSHLESAIVSKNLNTYNIICQLSQTHLSAFAEQPSMIAKISSIFSQILMNIDQLCRQRLRPIIKLPSKSSNSDSDYIETTDESQGESESPHSPQSVSPYTLPIDKQNIIQQFISSFIGPNELLMQQIQLLVNYYYTSMHGAPQLTRMLFIELTKLILPSLPTKSILAKFYQLMFPSNKIYFNQDELRTLYILAQGNKPEPFSVSLTIEQYFIETFAMYLLRNAYSTEQKCLVRSMNHINNIREAYLSFRLIMQGNLKLEPIVANDLTQFIQRYFSNYINKENTASRYTQLVIKEQLALNNNSNPLLNKIIRVINKVSTEYPINHPIQFAIYDLKLQISEQEPHSPDAMKLIITNWAASTNPWISSTNRQLCMEANAEITNAFCFFSSSSKPITTILLEQCNKEISAMITMAQLDERITPISS